MLECPPDDQWFDQFPSGQHNHPRAELVSLWDRIYKKWKDRRLCEWWWDRRRKHTIEAWIHGFKSLAEKEKQAKKDGVKLENPGRHVMMCAVGYDRNPERWKQIDEAKEQQAIYQNSLPKVVVLTDEKRAYWNALYARQKAKALAK